jgi:RecA/RadA recombinase
MSTDKETDLSPAEAKEAKARASALDAAKSQIEKQFGAGSLMKLGDRPSVDVDAIPTGALPLDIALGVGGIPRGRIVEIFGPESSGKTTLVYHIIAEAQKRGGICAFVDAEHAIDPIYAKRLRSGRSRRGRFRRSADSQGRARGSDGRGHGRPSGPADVTGAQEVGRQSQ